jgi:hypothetical protein
MIIHLDPGSWPLFVKRRDNVGRPIMEVKQKYLIEYHNHQSELFHVLSAIASPGQAGSGGGPPQFTPSDTIYVDPDYIDPNYF